MLGIAVLDALGLDNSLARGKVLTGAAGAAAKLLAAEREQARGVGGAEPHREAGGRIVASAPVRSEVIR